jgi:hypothetical protein
MGARVTGGVSSTKRALSTQQFLCLSRTRRLSGIGFGDYGDNHVRFALIENEERTRQALRGIKAMLAKGVVPA